MSPSKTAVEECSGSVCNALKVDTNTKEPKKLSYYQLLFLLIQGYLETKLSKLYGELVGLQSSLSSLPDSVPTLFHPVLKHQLSHVTSTCDLVGECCHELMCLSLLVPTAPWVGDAFNCYIALNKNVESRQDRMTPKLH